MITIGPKNRLTGTEDRNMKRRHDVEESQNDEADKPTLVNFVSDHGSIVQGSSPQVLDISASRSHLLEFAHAEAIIRRR